MFRVALLLLCASLAIAAPEAPTVVLELGEFSYFERGSAAVEIKASAPLLTLGEGELTGLLSSDPPVNWLCQFTDELSLRCATPQKRCVYASCPPAQTLPPATPVRLQVATGALLAQSGAPVAGLDVAVESTRAVLQGTIDGADALGRPRVQL